MEILDYYRDIQARASTDAVKSTCHFLKTVNNNPESHGSGVFIEIDQNYFLITAAHVIEGQENDIYIGIGEHEALKLGGDLIVNALPAGRHRDKDKIDIAILRLNQETINKLSGKYSFIRQSELGVNHELKLLPMYISVGFPATKSKYNRVKDEIKSKPFIYTTMPASTETYSKLKCDLFTNIIVHYDKKRVKNYKTGLFNTGPDPYGISGSGLWFIPPQLEMPGQDVNKKLVGIATEWSENKKYWICTRIDIFTEMIRQRYNLNIPQSRIVKLNLG
jgi:hypothetical protein